MVKVLLQVTTQWPCWHR